MCALWRQHSGAHYVPQHPIMLFGHLLKSDLQNLENEILFSLFNWQVVCGAAGLPQAFPSPGFRALWMIHA